MIQDSPQALTCADVFSQLSVLRVYNTGHENTVGKVLIDQCVDLADDSALPKSLAIACIVDELEMDAEAVAAALLAFGGAANWSNRYREKVSQTLPANILALISGVSLMDSLSSLSHQSVNKKARDAQKGNTENLRRMLIAMIDDVRVVVIKLAERLHNMRCAKDADAVEKQALARNTLDVYTPLANRLGVWQLKWELEDLSLRYLEPQAYHDLAKRLAERRVDREHYIGMFLEGLKNVLSANNIICNVYGRPKNIYSIWKKMRRKALDFEHIFDVRAVRIVCNNVADCYAALGIVHTQWPNVGGEFDDYIATPKENGYQSIHTAVSGSQGKVVEVQIRTHDMHKENELGVAAHWRYKEQAKQNASVDQKVLWLRQLLEWRDALADINADDATLIKHLQNDAFEQRVYAFTPKGQIIDLPKGATGLDFAYAVHTEVGHRCRGVKVNGRIAPLNRQLLNGEQVEVLTIKSGHPSRDWLNGNAGYLKTSRARARVQRWFKEVDFEQNVSAGRSMLDKELHRLGLHDVKLETLAQALRFKQVDEYFAAIGSGRVKVSQAVAPLKERLEPRESGLESRDSRRKKAAKSSQGLNVKGVGNLLTQLARCCGPVPGEQITGYITMGRGVTIHRTNCRNVLRANEQMPERLIEVEWGVSDEKNYPVDVLINAYDRASLIADITNVIASLNVSLLAMNLTTDADKNMAVVRLTLEISDVALLRQALGKIQQVPNVFEVKRIM